MRVIRGLGNIKTADRGVAISLGNYDGVHRGHRALFAELQRAAPDLRRCAICFEPQPLEFLRPAVAPIRLQGLAEKLRCLEALEVHQVLVLRFDAELAAMSAEDFIRRVLVEGLAAQHVIVGDDYRFGHQRRGDIGLLRALAGQYGYQVDHLPTVTQADDRVSSTAIRSALAAGEIALANSLLGRAFRLRGRVVHGQKLGRELGAATANISLRRKAPLRYGVYCVRLDGQPAVANIGVRPTVGGDQELLEVHVLEGVHELYDQMVNVEFLQFLREELKFDDLASLQAAIADDLQQARTYFYQENL